VILLPHMGTYTHETQENMELWTISNVRSVLEKGELRSRVKEQDTVDFKGILGNRFGGE
jgi:glyoxylate reductase